MELKLDCPSGKTTRSCRILDTHAHPTELLFMVVLPRKFGHVCAQLGSIPPMELLPRHSPSRLKEKITAVHGAAVLSQQRPKSSFSLSAETPEY